PGGLTSPGRKRPELNDRGFWVSRGEGAYLWDIEGRRYIDINCGHGGAQAGHSHPAIISALHRTLERGILCGQETLLPARVASRIGEGVLGADLVRFTFTGTKATELAVMVARAYTGRMNIVRFEGHYHGYNEYLQFSMWPPLDKAGPREAPRVVPTN